MALNQLSGMTFFEGVASIKDGIIGGINSLLFAFLPDNPTIIVLVFSILIGIGIKRWKKLKWSEGIFLMVLWYGFLRWLGIGG